MFMKILTKEFGGKKHYYASLVENKRMDGRVVQSVKANLGPVTEDQIPFLKAAYAKNKPRIVYDDRPLRGENPLCEELGKMKKTEGSDDINAIVSRVKAEVREGMAGKKMTLTDISLKMTAAFDEIRDAFTEEIEEVVREGQDTGATSCPECGDGLKKTGN